MRAVADLRYRKLLEIGTIYSFLDLENQGGNCKCLELRIICNMFDVKEIDLVY